MPIISANSRIIQYCFVTRRKSPAICSLNLLSGLDVLGSAGLPGEDKSVFFAGVATLAPTWWVEPLSNFLSCFTLPDEGLAKPFFSWGAPFSPDEVVVPAPVGGNTARLSSMSKTMATSDPGMRMLIARPMLKKSRNLSASDLRYSGMLSSYDSLVSSLFTQKMSEG